MAFSFKDYEVGKLNLNILNSIKENLGPNSNPFSGTLESIDIEAEEKYLNNLRIQREKIEQFQQEMKKKDEKIKELESFITISSAKSHIACEVDILNQELKEKDQTCTSLRNQLKKQLDEYEKSLIEIQKASKREVEEKNKEIRSLKQKLADKEKIVNDLNKEMEGLRNEIYKLSEVQRDSNPVMSPSKQKYAEAKLRLSQKDQEIALLKKSQEDYQKRTGLEVTNLQSELQRAVGIVSRQESTIQELRKRVNDDGYQISMLTDQISTKQAEISRIMSTLNISPLRNKSTFLAKDQVSVLQEENRTLKTRLVEFKKKEESDKIERKKSAQLKIEMISQRNAEVNKLSDALKEVMKGV